MKIVPDLTLEACVLSQKWTEGGKRAVRSNDFIERFEGCKAYAWSVRGGGKTGNLVSNDSWIGVPTVMIQEMSIMLVFGGKTNVYDFLTDVL